MSRSRVRRAVSAVVVALLVTACVPQESQRQSLDDLVAEVEAANAASEADGGDHDGHDHGDEGEESAEEPAPQRSDGAVEAATEPAPEPSAPSADEPSPEPAAAQPPRAPGGPTLEQYDDFPIEVTLSRSCVERGGEMTVTVDAFRQDAAVVYIAFYAGEESGGPPPYGDGHGGNNGDMSDTDGRYQDTWVVSPTAPVGPARVEVRVGYRGERSTGLVRFEVVAPGSGSCGE